MEMEEIKKNSNPIQDENVELETFIVFHLGEEEYGIKIEQVKEVTITSGITKVPQAPDHMLGVSNIRGDIIPVLDLEKKLKLVKERAGHSPSGPTGRTYTLVLEKKGFKVGIEVKDVPETLTLVASQIDKTPEIIKNRISNERFVEGIAKVDDRLIIILESEKIINQEEEQQHINL